MLFEQVYKEHILLGIKDYEEKGLPNEFGPSSTYDFVYNGKRYPPKAIMAYANYHATGRKIERYFKGGEGTDCFMAFERNGFEIIPKSQNMETINVKQEFAQWLFRNAPDSYKQYLGVTAQSIVERLNEMDAFFPEVSLFEIEGEGPNKIVDFILDKISRRKERIKNQPFFDYDDKNGNGIPKAVLGRNNYIQFLNEKFKNSKSIATNYWVFQGNPKVFDFKTALEQNLVDNWTVSAHKDKIKIGDKVIIWITGSKSGCYALAEITSEPSIVDYSRDDHLWKVEDKNQVKAGLKITHNLINKPITKSEIDTIEELKKLNIGIQGSNFKATKEEYESILKIAQKYEDNEFIRVLKGFSHEDLTTFFSFLFEALDKFDIKEGDDRLLFSSTNGNLSLNIGQRLSWWMTRSNEKGRFGVLSKDKIRDNSQEVSGNKPIPFFTHMNGVDFSESDKDSIFKAFDQELKRTIKTSYRKHNDFDFEKAVHDKLFRAQFIKTETMENNNTVLNKILYGPPGTGKTYMLKDKYFEKFILKEKALTKNEYLKDIVEKLTWWQVISIAVLDIKTPNVQEIFDHDFIIKKAELSNSKTVRQTIWGQLQSHTVEECENVKVKSKMEPLLFYKRVNSTWTVNEELLHISFPEAKIYLNEYSNYVPKSLNQIINYEFVTFHQSFSYEDFIEGIKPVITDDSNELKYEICDGVFKKLCLRAKSNPEQDYAIFIDEINRGNVSSIFGELITLLEVDKRLGNKNALTVKLPYSKTNFGVPNNLYLFGTMNTADRSVEALDTALRRRFSFVEMMPNLEVIKNEVVDGIHLADILKTINERIELLVDRDHTIGHSYFIDIDSKQALADAFNDKIIPLLQEYFYGDYGKIGLVLGKGFIEKMNNSKREFAQFEYEGQGDFKTPTFVLKRVDESSIMEAIELLLANKNDKQENN